MVSPVGNLIVVKFDEFGTGDSTASKIRCHGIISSSACDPLSFEQRLMKLMPAPGAGDGTGLYDDAAP